MKEYLYWYQEPTTDSWKRAPTENFDQKRPQFMVPKQNLASRGRFSAFDKYQYIAY